jgi:hypothetical protein
MADETGELIQQYKRRFRNGSGAEYTIQTWGRRDENGSWVGWLEYHPLEDGLAVKRTPPETTQPGRRELSYWSSGLERRYLEERYNRAR